jgi:opacity protein-like surface antigen
MNIRSEVSRAANAALVALALLLASSTASAQNFGWASTEFDRDGYYAGLGVGAGIDMEFEDSDLGEDKNVTPGYGLNIRAGTKSAYFGGEFQLEYLNGFDVDGGAFAKGYDNLTFTVNIKAYLPFGRIQPFLVIGGGMNILWANTDLGNKIYTGGALRGGGGVDFYLTRNWGIDLQGSYVLTTQDTRDTDYLSVNAGVFYRF